MIAEKLASLLGERIPIHIGSRGWAAPSFEPSPRWSEFLNNPAKHHPKIPAGPPPVTPPNPNVKVPRLETPEELQQKLLASGVPKEKALKMSLASVKLAALLMRLTL